MREKARTRKRKREVERPLLQARETLVYLPKLFQWWVIVINLCKFGLHVINSTSCHHQSTINLPFWVCYSVVWQKVGKERFLRYHHLILCYLNRISSQLKLVLRVFEGQLQAGYHIWGHALQFLCQFLGFPLQIGVFD